MTQLEKDSPGSLVALVLQSNVGEWLATLTLIFSGCCSNALSLELATKQNPHAGTLITFAQFVLISAYALSKNIYLKPDDSLSPGLVLNRDELARRSAAAIVHYYAQRKYKRTFSVRITGSNDNSQAFTDKLGKELHVTLPALTIEEAQSSKQVERCLLAHKEKNIVLCHGQGATLMPAPLTKWDYDIVIVSDLPSKQGKPDPRFSASSLLVEIASPTRSNIIYSSTTSSLSFKPKWLISLTRIRLQKRKIPLSRWVIQVVLFFITSLLNNAAFGYNVPMSVHIIFRSGGLVVNMLMGWLIDGRRYSPLQIGSVLMVSVGVMFTTLSAAKPSTMSSMLGASSTGTYAAGIALLTLALIMSGLMGLEQDRVYTKYGRGHWQEAMFYLHLLALPGFGFVWRDVVDQIRTVNAGARRDVSLEMLSWVLPKSAVHPFLKVSVPAFYAPLLLNTITQLVCVSGVNRLTSRVNSLTVTLVLVVRKAVSLGISVLWLGKGRGENLLWSGAGLVLVGTIGYTMSSSKSRSSSRRSRVEELGSKEK